jgi:Fic family protein
MPIPITQWNDGTEPKRKKLQVNILKILEANPDKALSSIDFENIFNTRRQSINQALRALEAKGKITRGFVKENQRYVCYAAIKVKK